VPQAKWRTKPRDLQRAVFCAHLELARECDLPCIIHVRDSHDDVIELLRATGVLCVHGSGFGMDPRDGYFRMVFLAPPAQLNEIWDLIGDFNKSFLAR